MKNLVVLYLLFLISCFSSFSQNKEVEIIYAGSLEIDKKNYPGYKILKKSNTKQVHLLHNGLEIWSDKVFFQQIENNLNSYGNVVLKQGDSLILTCDNLDYDGNTKIAIAQKNVILDDKKMILKTQKLYYNRNLEIVEYPEKGTLFDSATTIQSDKGIYYTSQNKYRFESNVNVSRNDLNIKSSKMDFYTSSNKSFFLGPTTIIGEDYIINCDNGLYEIEGKKGFFKKNASIKYNFKELLGDSIFFDKELGFASAKDNIKLTDTLNNSIITGTFGKVFKDTDSVMITHKAVAINLIDKDSLFIRADTLISTGKSDNRITRGFKNVRIFKNNFSAKSDSIVFNNNEGLVKLFRNLILKDDLDYYTPNEISAKNPVLWSNNSQITGDEIHIKINDKKIDSLIILNNSFVAEQDSLNLKNFNQLKGIRLEGKFGLNGLEEIDLIKNTEMIYYLYDDNNLELTGIDKAICSSMKIIFEEKSISEMIFFTDPDGTTFPPDEIPENSRKLIGFFWRGDEKIKSKDEIYHEFDFKKFVP